MPLSQISAGGGGGEPVLRDERRHVLELLGRGTRVQGAAEVRDELVRAEALEHGRIPAVGAHQQVAVALEVGRQAAEMIAQRLESEIGNSAGGDRRRPAGPEGVSDGRLQLGRLGRICSTGASSGLDAQEAGAEQGE